MSINSNESTGVGNTRLPRKEIQSKRWCFTLNNYTDIEYGHIINVCIDQNIVQEFIIGKEIGKQNGIPHLQGYIEFKKKITMAKLKSINCKMHIEKALGSRAENVKYCRKDGIIKYSLNCKPPKELRILETSMLYDWQTEIINTVESDPDDRTIHWYYSKSGLTGKTTFAKYLAFYHNAVILEGKKNDILYVAAEYESELYIYDLERSMETYVSYGALEKIKNGHYMVGKYEGKTILRNCPHVFVFANFKPEMEKLSKDRWHLVNIKKFRPEVKLNIFGYPTWSCDILS